VVLNLVGRRRLGLVSQNRFFVEAISLGEEN
jgi:hypothetical protein